MDGKLLTTLFRLNAFVIEANLEGMTEEAALRSPAGGGNCANWVIGHIVATRNSFLPLAGEKEALAPEEAKRYARGSEPILSADGALSLGRLLASYRESQERLTRAIEGLGAGGLARKGLEKGIGGESVGEQLAGFAFHEAYHAGQLGLLRRLAGLDGRIR